MNTKYMKLVACCPLLPITNKEEHAAAKKMIIELTKRDGELSKEEIGYSKVLVQLIQTYERQIVAHFFDNVGGADALEYLLNEHKMRQAEAARIAGISKQNLNDFLKGRRGLARAARIRLAAHFKVDEKVFELPEEFKNLEKIA